MLQHQAEGLRGELKAPLIFTVLRDSFRIPPHTILPFAEMKMFRFCGGSKGNRFHYWTHFHFSRGSSPNGSIPFQ